MAPTHAAVATMRRSVGGRRGARLVLALALTVAGAGSLCRSSVAFISALAGGRQPTAQQISIRQIGRGDRVPRASRGGEDSVGIVVGDKVKACSPDDEQWYPGKIEKANGDGTFTVKWDDPDGGPETHDIGPDGLKKIIIFKDYKVADDCKAISEEDERWYPGVIAKINGDGTFQVKWDDPDGGPETQDTQPDVMKKVLIFKNYKVEDVVDAKFPSDGGMYPATVVKDNKDGTFTVKWEDPDGSDPESVVSVKNMKYPPIPFDKLEVGQKYKGMVRTIMDFGAFVDIGSENDGLLHISRIVQERISDVHDYLEEGQDVDVWISGIRDEGKFGLTMIEGRLDGGGGGRAPADLTPFAGLSPDDWQTGIVKNIAPFGAFVEVTLEGGAAAQGLVHISAIRDGFVDNVEDELETGQEVKVRVLSVDSGAGKMSLSMKEGGFGGGGGGERAPRAPSADLSLFEGMASDKFMPGTVARVASFGAFVTVKAPNGETADGLVHITQIREGFVESVEDELEVGQEVQVRVQSVDVGGGKLSLSMKPAGEY